MSPGVPVPLQDCKFLPGKNGAGFQENLCVGSSNSAVTAEMASAGGTRAGHVPETIALFLRKSHTASLALPFSRLASLKKVRNFLARVTESQAKDSQEPISSATPALFTTDKFLRVKCQQPLLRTII